MKKNKPYFPKLCLSGSGHRVAGVVLSEAVSRFRLLCIMCLAVLTFATTANAQTITVSGVVSEVSGAPMPGVNVFIKGTPSAGTITTIDGSYTLKGVPAGTVLHLPLSALKHRMCRLREKHG